MTNCHQYRVYHQTQEAVLFDGQFFKIIENNNTRHNATGGLGGLKPHHFFKNKRILTIFFNFFCKKSIKNDSFLSLTSICTLKQMLRFLSFPIIIIIINNLFTVGVINERLIAIKKLIKANYL